MNLKRSISNMLFGLSVPQEYVCLASEQLTDPFSFHLTGKDQGFYQDITNIHLFLGYKPVIIGVPVSNANEKYLQQHHELCLSVSHKAFVLNNEWRGFLTSRDSIARLTLQKKDVVNIGSATIALFQAEQGMHSFISAFHQATINVRQKTRSAKKEAIRLDGNLADQVRIVYSIPRVVSVITLLAPSGEMNMFPTDLHGSINESNYSSSLRIGGKANNQVDHVKRIVLSEVDAKCYNEVYALGKNHMKDPQPISSFDTKELSKQLEIPLPSYAISYRELEVMHSMDIGIHRIYFYKVLNRVAILSADRLTHFHQYAAQWRENHRLQTPSLFRS
jgi:flavin reductase (DIM6/NTAB) family NADH-FMN oxidoreductase RutF